jgi:hypothetical protein
MPTTYTIADVDIYDIAALRTFLLTVAPRSARLYSVTYDSPTRSVIVVTNEATVLPTTEALLNDFVRNQYSNMAQEIPLDVEEVAIVSDSSGNGLFPTTSSADGDVIIDTNRTLTRNMYYNNLTVNENVVLNSNGWRIVVVDTLKLFGTIANNGLDAIGITPGASSSQIGTTYLGAGSAGGAGLTAMGPGNPGAPALHSCCGGSGGRGGIASFAAVGGPPGVFRPVMECEGGLRSLSTMPIAFLGRLLSTEPYLQGATGGGSGGCDKGGASVVKSGAGGSGAGFIIIAARKIEGFGKIAANGGNGSSASATGVSNGIGGGGGGGGGCIVIITQTGVPDTITLHVKGGLAGQGVDPGLPGEPGKNGNIFILKV